MLVAVYCLLVDWFLFLPCTRGPLNKVVKDIEPEHFLDAKLVLDEIRQLQMFEVKILLDRSTLKFPSGPVPFDISVDGDTMTVHVLAKTYDMAHYQVYKWMLGGSGFFV